MRLAIASLSVALATQACPQGYEVTASIQMDPGFAPYPQAINDLGVITYHQAFENSYHATFVWDHGLGMSVYGQGHAVGIVEINNMGHLAGSIYDPESGYHQAAIWYDYSQPLIIQEAGGFVDMNDRDVVIGG